MFKLLSFIGFFILGILSSLIINKLLLQFSESLGIRNKNDINIRWSNRAKPSLGGISLFIGFLAAIIFYMIFIPTINLFSITEFVCLFIAVSLAFLMGLADDAYNTKPLLKLLIQITCGLIVAYSGIQIKITDVYILNVILTSLWVVILMNSINMLDNMDGIATIVCIYILITCLLTNIIFGVDNNSAWNLIMLTTIGSLIGFLAYNFSPAKMFMGDSGSQFLGLICAIFSLKFLWGLNNVVSNVPFWGILVAIILCFVAPCIDTITVVINRIKNKTSPFVGGKDHTTHHLFFAGYTERKIFYIFLIIGTSSSLLSILLLLVDHNHLWWLSTLAIVYFVAIFYFLYRNTILYKQN